jgi:hypothetical protein
MILRNIKKQLLTVVMDFTGSTRLDHQIYLKNFHHLHKPPCKLETYVQNAVRQQLLMKKAAVNATHVDIRNANFPE